jgi:hypothetical protein
LEQLQQHSGEGSEQNSCNNNWGFIWMANLKQLLFLQKTFYADAKLAHWVAISANSFSIVCIRFLFFEMFLLFEFIGFHLSCLYYFYFFN